MERTTCSLEGYDQCYVKTKQVIAYFYKNMHTKIKFMFYTVQRESVGKYFETCTIILGIWRQNGFQLDIIDEDNEFVIETV